jgi:hypothetical protein
MSAKDAIKAREDAKKPKPAPKPKAKEKPVVALPVEITEVPKGPDGES